MSLTQTIQEEIADNLDKRRFEITNLHRVLLNYTGKPLESTALRMAIPLLYANWEGYVREVCQLYLEYIESTGVQVRNLKPGLLGYLWTPALKPLIGGLDFEKKKIIAELALNCMENSVHFEDSERAINTKSNLNFDVLKNISNHLCLETTTLEPWKQHLNALVNIRNNIAHGSILTALKYYFFEEHASSLISLMEEFEKVIIQTLENNGFCKNTTKI
ncbi:MAG: MAE_28990/MAE_18760 family HEPN-like nuclease [Candidatus Scalindua sp.]|nr:MAE_28990/MAE_18760 family HEPN-like nuclease [Candidatus Scalindua sp.]